MKRKKHIKKICCGMFCAAAVSLSSLQVGAAPSQADRNAYLAVFDADYYYNAYPDLAAAFGNDTAALFDHFVNYGIAEGRSASAEFNPLAYRQRYADLQTAFGTDMAAYCLHYVTHGKAEGRTGSADGITIIIDPAIAVSAQPPIGTYTTYYKTNVPRANNVELAAQRINGIVVQPGGSFSFSQTILPRTAANGYVVAPVFVNKKVSKGTGGGICQVSSTLYAAMLNAGLPATERHPHSLPVDYLPEGLDATISGTALDLKFDNIYSQPIMIQASAANGALTVSLTLM